MAKMELGFEGVNCIMPREFHMVDVKMMEYELYGRVRKKDDLSSYQEDIRHAISIVKPIKIRRGER